MKKFAHFLLSLAVTLLALIAIELPYSRYMAPAIHAQQGSETLDNLTVSGASNLQGTVNIGTTTASPAVTISASSMTTTAEAGQHAGCNGDTGTDYQVSTEEMLATGDFDGTSGTGSIRVLEPNGMAPPQIAPIELAPFSCFSTTHYLQHWTTAGGLGMGPVTITHDSTQTPMDNASLIAQDANGNVRATMHATDDGTAKTQPSGNANGQIYMGVMRSTGGDKFGASVEVDASGNFIVTLPTSGTGSEAAAIAHAKQNGLGIPFPKPDPANIRQAIQAASPN